MPYHFDPEQPALGHPLKQVSHRPVKHCRFPVKAAGDIAEHPLGQQAHVLGVQAEDYLVQVAGQLLRVFVPLLHVRHDFPEQPGRLPGNVFHRANRAQLRRDVEGVAQLVQVVGLVQFQYRYLVQHRLHPRKVGANQDGLKGGNDEQRRGFQIDLVAEQLGKGPFQLAVPALELPAEMVFQVGVGPPARHRLLKGKGFRVAVFRRRGVARQGAKVIEKRLRPLTLPKAAVFPLGDKFRRRHRNPILSRISCSSMLQQPPLTNHPPTPKLKICSKPAHPEPVARPPVVPAPAGTSTAEDQPGATNPSPRSS